MPLPKWSLSRSRRDKRRTQLNLKATGLSRCSNCGASSLSNQICASCGYYRGRQVVPVKVKAKGKKA